MTESTCFAPEDLEEILALKETDPRLRHAHECPRCRALIDSYRLYREARSDFATSEIADADARLSQAIEREIGVPILAAPLPARATREPRRSPGLLERLFHPALRPAWAFAVIAVALGGALLWPALQPHDGRLVLRGGTESGARALVVETALRGPNGVEMRWRSWPGADGYEVRFYSTDLSEIGRVPAGAETSLTIAPSRLPAGRPASERMLFRVYALVRGESVAASRARLLEPR